jgi:hypothetical protein
MDMTIDINAVNFVEHAELLDVVLDNMQPGHIIHVDVTDTEYAFLKRDNVLFYRNVDGKISTYNKQDLIKFINGRSDNPHKEKAWRAEITAADTIGGNIVEYDKILESLNRAKEMTLIPTTPFLKYGSVFLNLAHNFKPASTLEVAIYILELRKQVASNAPKKKSCKKK